ncbi:hypothetical protein ACR1PO_21145 [Chryseobacterium sp. RRHN12]|uniref:hypothetical protein n=1 Tax=Chryseobacterium sp. RRHN12 TaxID=3437884 RepID=UPI003D9B6246
MKKTALASGILLHLYSIKAQDTIRIKKQDTIPARNLKEDIALISSSGCVFSSKTPFFKKEWVKKSVAPAILFTAAAAT